MPKKTITRTRQYLCSSAICLRPRSCRDFTIIREEYRVQDVATIFFSLYQKHGNHTNCRPKSLLHGLSLNKSPIKNHATLFGLGRVVKPDQTKLGSTKPNISCAIVFTIFAVTILFQISVVIPDLPCTLNLHR